MSDKHVLLRSAIVILLVCLSNSAIAACDIEIRNAHKTSERILVEWPIRSVNDDETQYVRKIVDYLIPIIKLNLGSNNNFNWPLNGKWEFLLIRDLSANAYSIGNGKVYITDGIYHFVKTEAELAAIIAHEMAHQLMGHFCEESDSFTIRPIGSFSQALDNTREIEADLLAVKILQHTDFPPQAMLTVIEDMSVFEKESAHKESRIKALKKQLQDIELIPFSPSSEFLRIRQSQDIGFVH